MQISQMFKRKPCVFSIECFPPKQTANLLGSGTQSQAAGGYAAGASSSSGCFAVCTVKLPSAWAVTVTVPYRSVR